MFCTKCGREVNDGSPFCTWCGEKMEYYKKPEPVRRKIPKPRFGIKNLNGQRNKGLTISSLTALIGAVLFVIGLFLPSVKSVDILGISLKQNFFDIAFEGMDEEAIVGIAMFAAAVLPIAIALPLQFNGRRFLSLIGAVPLFLFSCFWGTGLKETMIGSYGLAQTGSGVTIMIIASIVMIIAAFMPNKKIV